MKTRLQDEGRRLAFWCPGCDQLHAVVVMGVHAWNWDGDRDTPTITPSIRVTGYLPITDDQVQIIRLGGTIEPTPMVCHSFVTVGAIQFLSDSTHHLAGQTVPIPDWPTT